MATQQEGLTMGRVEEQDEVIRAYGTVTPPDYHSWPVERLRAELVARGLDPDGHLNALIERLEADNERIFGNP